MIEKRTIQKKISISGKGIHSGESVTLTLKPSSLGRIIFRRIDLANLEIEVDPKTVEARNCSSLVFASGRIQTIEHLLAVLHILGLDSLEIELDKGELPIMDGSAAPLAAAILGAGTRSLPESKKVIKILKPYVIQEDKASLSFGPDPDFRITYVIDFPHPLIGRQEISIAPTRQSFLDEIAPARTFGFYKDVAELYRRGLALGGSLENAVVLDEEKVISGPLRYSDEFVRHKVLDLIGDLALIGRPLLGHFRADRAGHGLHLKVVHFLLDHPDFWAFEEAAAPRHLGA
jgi:UDP-3-O-[3-hydroxymyristoyl] N-acetylglucosamine deacetylase